MISWSWILCRGGTFLFSFKVSPLYPHDAPKVKCKTKVWALEIFPRIFVISYMKIFFFKGNNFGKFKINIWISAIYFLVCHLYSLLRFTTPILSWKAMCASIFSVKTGSLSWISTPSFMHCIIFSHNQITRIPLTRKLLLWWEITQTRLEAM